MREVISRTGIIDPTFIKEVNNLRAFIISAKKDCDDYERSSPSNTQIIEFINNLSDVYIKLDQYFERIWLLVKNLPQESYRHYQIYIQKLLLPYFSTPPLNSRIYEKPLGYDGDYIMMNYYYNNGYEGKSVFDILMHRYTLNLPIAKATINRFKYLYNDILSTFETIGSGTKISSLGCGPANEIIDFIKAENVSADIIFNCIDAEPKAIEEIRNKIQSFVPTTKTNFHINLFNYNILKYIKISRKDQIINNQDLIFAGGLFDYLVDKVAQRLIEAMFALLAKNGTIVITNFSKNIPSRAYLELIGRWYLILRNEEDMIKLCSNIYKTAKIDIKRDNETKTLLYLTITK